MSFEFSDKRLNPSSGSVMESSSQEFRGLTSIGATTLADFLNYLSDQGAATILAEKTLTVASGQEGVLDSTIGVPEIAYSFSKDQGLSILTERKDDFDGILVRLSPTVAMQSAEIEVEVRSPVGISKTGSPIFLHRPMLRSSRSRRTSSTRSAPWIDRC